MRGAYLIFVWLGFILANIATALRPSSPVVKSRSQLISQKRELSQKYDDQIRGQADPSANTFQGAEIGLLQSNAWNEASAGLGLGPDMFISPIISGIAPGSVQDFIQKLGNWLASTVPARLSGFLTGQGDEHRPIAIIWMIIDIVMMILQILYDITVMALQIKQQVIEILLKLRRAAILMKAATAQAKLAAEAERKLIDGLPLAPSANRPASVSADTAARARAAVQRASEAALSSNVLASAGTMQALADRARSSAQAARAVTTAAQSRAVSPALRRQLHAAASSSRALAGHAGGLAEGLQGAALALRREAEAAITQARQAAAALSETDDESGRAKDGDPEEVLRVLARAVGAGGGGSTQGARRSGTDRGQESKGFNGPEYPVDGSIGTNQGSVGVDGESGVDRGSDGNGNVDVSDQGAYEGSTSQEAGSADPWVDLVGTGAMAGDTSEHSMVLDTDGNGDSDGASGDSSNTPTADIPRETEQEWILLQTDGTTSRRHPRQDQGFASLVAQSMHSMQQHMHVPTLQGGSALRQQAARESMSLLETQSGDAHPPLLHAVLQLRQAADDLRRSHDDAILLHYRDDASSWGGRDGQTATKNMRPEEVYTEGPGSGTAWRKSRGMGQQLHWTPWARSPRRISAQPRANLAGEAMAGFSALQVHGQAAGSSGAGSQHEIREDSKPGSGFLFPRMEDLEEYGAMGAVQKSMVDSLVHTLTASVGADVTAKASRALHAGLVEHTGREVAGGLGDAIRESLPAGLAPSIEAATTYGAVSGLVRTAVPAVYIKVARGLLRTLAARVGTVVARATSESLFGSERHGGNIDDLLVSGGSASGASIATLEQMKTPDREAARYLFQQVIWGDSNRSPSSMGSLMNSASLSSRLGNTAGSTECSGCVVAGWMHRDAAMWNGPRVGTRAGEASVHQLVAGDKGGSPDGQSGKGDETNAVPVLVNWLAAADCRRVCAASMNTTTGTDAAMIEWLASAYSSNYHFVGDAATADRLGVLRLAMRDVAARTPPVAGARTGADVVAALWAEAATSGSTVTPREAHWVFTEP